mmetsp:Transcript_31740/g.53325  ORF Transcript_31740/g.53325 Transcript_31740/m.53325 type:complete len:242 (+) Transcript_31740:1443-2168(+)
MTLIDDDSGVDGHITTPFSVTHLGHLLVIQKRVVVVSVAHAHPHVVHVEPDGGDDPLSARLVELLLAHLATLREFVDIIPPEERGASLVGGLEHAQLAEVLQDNVATSVANVQVVLWISGAVLSVGQALLLALAAVEVLVQAVVGQVVRLEQRVPTSLKLLGVNVEFPQERHDGVALVSTTVVAVRPELPLHPGVRMRKRISPVDDSDHSPRAVELRLELGAVRFREQSGRDTDVVHVFEG